MDFESAVKPKLAKISFLQAFYFSFAPQIAFSVARGRNFRIRGEAQPAFAISAAIQPSPAAL